LFGHFVLSFHCLADCGDVLPPLSSASSSGSGSTASPGRVPVARVTVTSAVGFTHQTARYGPDDDDKRVVVALVIGGATVVLFLDAIS
jgi:hypothetical protein